MSTEKNFASHNFEFWGGLECTINRVNDSYFDQLDLSGHYVREGDIELISELGIKTLRYPVLWEKHEPQYQQPIDWTFTNKIFNELSKYNITPIAGLLHHGSGPQYTSLLDEKFPELFASYAGKVAQKFPFLQYYTPINEPLTTARFSGLYALWYPHISNDVSFVKMLLNQVKGIILAMKEIRKINPDARLVQTEDLSKTYSTPSLSYQASFENERRWLTYDLLCGKERSGHTMRDYFIRLGISENALNFFIKNALLPDVMGFNYYITSERYLDDDFKKYPPHTHGGNEIQEYADVEAIRVSHDNSSGLKVLLEEAWQRYKLPLAITEAHINSGREDQLRWLDEVHNSCIEASKAGVNIKAMTFWSLFGAYGWNHLLTGDKMEYETGAFDLRSIKPRPTAIAMFIKNIIQGKKYVHPLLSQKGWWQQANRFYKSQIPDTKRNTLRSRPIIIIGKTGTLGQAFAKMCSYRNFPFVLTGREDLDITNEKIIQAFLDAFNPWAVINTAGFVRIDEAEDHKEECFRVNMTAAILLSNACKERNISFVTFSTDQVFDGQKKGPYYETDKVRPLNVYGASKAMAEKEMLQQHPGTLILRTSSFFGPWDTHNFAFAVLKSLSANETFPVSDDVFISPTYIPHLVTTSLDLLIDGECGLWHLANDGAVSWKEFAEKIAVKAGYKPTSMIGTNSRDLEWKAARPNNSVIRSEKANFLPSLDEAINYFFKECTTLPISVLKARKTFL
jgi:dTDP-4-dehydrorhamnose reductase